MIWFSNLLQQELQKIPSPPESKRLWLYGAGGYGRWLALELARNGWHVEGFIDQASTSPVACGLPVVSLEQWKQRIDRSVGTVGLGLFNHTVDVLPIVALLEQHGATVISPIALYRFLENSLPPDHERYWLAPIERTQKHGAAIEAAGALLATPRDLELYQNILRYRLSGHLQHLRAIAPEGDQYFPPGLFSKDATRCFIDCGAYTGDTLLYAQQHGFRLDHIVALEPGMAPFGRLVETVQTSLAETNAVLFPCGVGDSCKDAYFVDSGDQTGHVATHGGTRIPCVALDDVLYGFSPTFIKMDVEGSERGTLLGAAKMIQKHRPILAISIYHRPEDLWELPLLIAEWNLNYAFSLRVHSFQGYDTVLYAVPLS